MRATKITRPWESLSLRLLDPPEPGGHYFFSNNAPEGIPYFISPLLYRKTALDLLFPDNNCFWACWACFRVATSFKFHK